MKTSRSTPYPAVLFKEYEDHSTLGMTVTAEPCLQCVHGYRHGKYKWLVGLVFYVPLNRQGHMDTVLSLNQRTCKAVI